MTQLIYFHFHVSAYITHLNPMGLEASTKLPLSGQFDYGLCIDIRCSYGWICTHASVCLRQLSNMTRIHNSEVVIDMHIKLFGTRNSLSFPIISPFLCRTKRSEYLSFFGGCIHLRIILQCHSNSSNINKILDRFLNIFIYMLVPYLFRLLKRRGKRDLPPY